MLPTGNNSCPGWKIKLLNPFTALRKYNILQNALLALLLPRLQADLFIVRPYPALIAGTELINVTKLSHSFSSVYSSGFNDMQPA
jgi:hypothetical protein